MVNTFSLQPYLRTLCSQTPKPLFRGLATTPSPDQTNPSPPKFPFSSLSCHWDTLPPTPHQLKHATKFFEKWPPSFLWSAEKFKTMDFGESPEVCFLGRSNVGKSSLLNALMGKKLAHTSSKPGRTKFMNAFAVGGSEDDGKNRLIVLDMQGYGKGGRAEWGTQIMKYLNKRKELKRAFLLIDAQHGVKDSDRQLIQTFKEQGVPFQVILAKVDRVLFRGSRMPGPESMEARFVELRTMMESVKAAVQPDLEDDGGAVGDVIACSSEKWIDGKRLGIDAVRFAILRAAGLEFKPKVKLASPVEVVPYDEIPHNSGPALSSLDGH